MKTKSRKWRKMNDYRIVYKNNDGYNCSAYVTASNPEEARKAAMLEYADINQILYIDQIGLG